MNNLELIGVSCFKKGSGIHIKEKNKGKFTASAKAAGKSVQEHARDVLNDPNATPLQKKRANFARNSRAWKHQEGGVFTTSPFTKAPVTRPSYYKEKDFRFYEANPAQMDREDAALARQQEPNIYKDIKTTKNRPYDPRWIQYAEGYLSKDLNKQQVDTALGTMIEESGGNPFVKSDNGTYQGLLQWGSDRYRIPEYSNVPSQRDTLQEMNNQLEYYISTLKNTKDRVSWTHGGEGSGYKSYKDPYNTYHNSSSLPKVFRAHSFGYVRPEGKQASYRNRLKVAKQVANRRSQ